MALSGHTETICYLSAFGAKQTSDEAAAWFDPTLLTLSGSRWSGRGDPVVVARDVL
jgi:hypothetical protein